jgi:hypothetical protein
MSEVIKHLQAFAGVDAQTAPHLIAEDHVQTATNVDFSFEEGAAVVRKGSALHQSLAGSSPLTYIYRHYNNANSIDASPYYYAAQNGDMYRTVSGTPTLIATGTASGIAAASSYKNHTYISADAGATQIKDDGTTTTDWIKQKPNAAPNVTLNTLSPLTVCNTWTVSEGSLTSGGTSTATATTTSTDYRITFEGTPPSTNLSTNGGEIGDYGVDFLDILLSNPSLVTRVSRDYSIGGTDFTNYYHTEMDIQFNDVEEVMPDPATLIEAEQNDGNTAEQLTNETRDGVSDVVRQAIRAPLTRVSAAANTFNAWGVSRPNFEFVGKYTSTSGASGWADIQKVRVVIEAQGPVSAQIRDWQVRGNRSYPLNDPNVGYRWWHTFATYDSDGFLIGESAPSDPSSLAKCQFSQAVIVSTATATGNHGLTHSLWYRQGGYMRDAYCIGTSSVANGTSGAIATTTFTDTLNDIQALANNKRLVTNVYAYTDFPHVTRAISDPHFSRLFTIDANRLRWSLPGQPDTFPKTSVLQVSHEGDVGQGLFSWNNSLVIVNRDSVYELTGNQFEGRDINYQLMRSGSRHGTKAPRTLIKTPYGIPLLDYDGIYLYQPGQGIDIPIDWAMKQIGDAFKGVTDADQAPYKGDRLPPINRSLLQDSVACFANNRLYLAVCTDANTYPTYVFVLDFATQRCWWYTYAFYITSMYWDAVVNRVLAGTSDGQVMELEKGTTDANSGGTSQSIYWRVRTRDWTTPSDVVMENVWLSGKLGTSNPTVLSVQYDNSGTDTALSTNTANTQTWIIPPLNGTFAHNLNFMLQGTHTSTTRQALYELGWEGLQHPKRVRFYRTPHTTTDHPGEKMWDLSIHDLEVINAGTSGTATILATNFVDEVAVSTATFTHTASSGRQIYMVPFPLQTYGDVAYTRYTAAGTNIDHVFKLWNSAFKARPEPPRISTLRTDVDSGEERIIDALDIDVNPLGTMTSTVFVDNVAISTFTTTGTNQQSYTYALPNETYGRTLYAIHNGASFKHYNTWFHTRNEPDRWTNYVTPRQSQDEGIWNAVNCDLDILSSTSTVLATAFIDNIALTTATLTGTKRQSFVFALPNETYGRTAYVIYNVTGGRCKHYNTWFDARPEPDRLANFTSPRQSGGEQWLNSLNSEVDCLSGTTTAVAYVDAVAVGTYTMTGTGRKQYLHTLPRDTYGRTFHTLYTCASGSRFKFYSEHWDGAPEPDRLTTHQTPVMPFPSNQHLKTWVAELNPLGTCTGTLYADNVVLATETFVGTYRKKFVVGLDVTSALIPQNAETLRVVYSGSSPFKHYSTDFETEPQPFGKQTWIVTYNKVGGATQLDQARFWALEAEAASGTATLTAIWDVDGRALSTSTITVSTQTWIDRIPFGPDGRGYIFQLRVYADADVQIYKSNLDVIQTGIKGLVRHTLKGTPN